VYILEEFSRMISVVYQFIARAVGHLSVEYVLWCRGGGLHLPLHVRVMFVANYFWTCKYAY